MWHFRLPLRKLIDCPSSRGRRIRHPDFRLPCSVVQEYAQDPFTHSRVQMFLILARPAVFQAQAQGDPSHNPVL